MRHLGCDHGRAWLAAIGPAPGPAAGDLHDLLDTGLAEALGDHASFRRFHGFAAHEPIPGRTGFVCFRRPLIRRGLDRMLFEAVTRQLDAKGVAVRTGTLADVTLITRSASIRDDGEARWAGYRRRKSVRHRYRADGRMRPCRDGIHADR